MKKFAIPIVFLFALLAAMFCENLLPYSIKSFFYAISLAIKECMIFVLPAVIFSLIHTSLGKIGVKSLKFLIFIVPLICCSNFLNTIISYFLGYFCIQADLISVITQSVPEKFSPLTPMFSFSLPKIISNDFALTTGAVSGILYGTIKKKNRNSPFSEVLERLSRLLDFLMESFFKILIPIMPLFIFGTALKLKHDKVISVVLSEYFTLAGIFVVSAGGYILMQLFLISRANCGRSIEYLKNLLPAIIAGFGSMSSAAALPLSIRAAEENCRDKNNAALVVPCSVNVHLVGDCFFIPFVALAISWSFGNGLPDFFTYLIFAVHFVVAKFAIAAVPGGGILVMLPILEKCLGFNADMLGLITAVYVMFDSAITACNVAGNGAFAIIFDRIAGAILRKSWKM
jgi:Na+/H+-dicarboxylate symporter